MNHVRINYSHDFLIISCRLLKWREPLLYCYWPFTAVFRCLIRHFQAFLAEQGVAALFTVGDVLVDCAESD